jgi:hypothetical protein
MPGALKEEDVEWSEVLDIRSSPRRRGYAKKQQKVSREKAWNLGYEIKAPVPFYASVRDEYCPFTHSPYFFKEQKKAEGRSLGKTRRLKGRKKRKQNSKVPPEPLEIAEDGSVSSATSSLPPPVCGSPYAQRVGSPDMGNEIKFRGIIAHEVKVCVQDATGKFVIGRVPLYSGDTFQHLRRRITRELGVQDFRFVAVDQVPNNKTTASINMRERPMTPISRSKEPSLMANANVVDSEVFIETNVTDATSGQKWSDPDATRRELEKEIHRIQTSIAAGDFASAPYLPSLKEQLAAMHQAQGHAQLTRPSNGVWSETEPPAVPRPPLPSPRQLAPLSVTAPPMTISLSSDDDDNELEMAGFALEMVGAGDNASMPVDAQGTEPSSADEAQSGMTRLEFADFSAAISASASDEVTRKMQRLSETYHQRYEKDVQEYARDLMCKLREKYEQELTCMQSRDAKVQPNEEAAAEESPLKDEAPADEAVFEGFQVEAEVAADEAQAPVPEVAAVVETVELATEDVPIEASQKQEVKEEESKKRGSRRVSLQMQRSLDRAAERERQQEEEDAKGGQQKRVAVAVAAEQDGQHEQEQPKQKEFDEQAPKKRGRRVSLQMQRSLDRAAQREKQKPIDMSPVAEQSDLSTRIEEKQEQVVEKAVVEGWLAELSALFDKLDKDSSGTVDKKEWGRSLSQNKELMAKYFGGESMAEIGKQFNRIDTDCSGDLTWEEVKNAVVVVVVEEKPAEVKEEKPVEAETKVTKVEYSMGAVLHSAVAVFSDHCLLLSFYECNESSSDGTASHLSIKAVNNQGVAMVSSTLSQQDWAGVQSCGLADMSPQDKLALCQALTQQLILEKGQLILNTAKRAADEEAIATAVSTRKHSSAASNAAQMVTINAPPEPSCATLSTTDTDELFKTLSSTEALASPAQDRVRSRSLRRPKLKAAPPVAPK